MTTSKRSCAVVEMHRILDRGPAVSKEALKDGVRLTGRWLHGAIHDRTAAMADHVVMTYYGAPQTIEWREGGKRLQSLTRPGSVTIIPKGHEARWDVGGAIEVSHVYLPDARLRACADALGLPHGVVLKDRVGFEDPVGSRLLEILAWEALGEGEPSRLFTEQAVDLLCQQLVRAHSGASPSRNEAPRGGLVSWQVRRVVDYMKANLDRDLGLDELAGLTGLSRFHFCSAFRRATGMAPHRCFVGLRMARARDLLLDPCLPISEIAGLVGYQTPSAFAVAFRKLERISPTEFRRRL